MRALFIEPFASLSHLSLYHSLVELFPEWEWRLETLPDRQWKWRNRVGALQIAGRLSPDEQFDILITGSLMNLAELLALRPNLQGATKIVYFHENQFAYPFRTNIGDDIKQIMYNNITTALTADVALFNSEFNRTTFLDGAHSFLNKLPLELDRNSVIQSVRDKSTVFHIPVQTGADLSQPRNNPPLILWNHRWEHDKQPEVFFEALYALVEEGLRFKVAVTGEQFDEAPEALNAAKSQLSAYIDTFGFIESRAEYEQLLARVDIVASTAAQEFYGISIIEAVANGAVPVLPDALSYPELFPAEFLYDPKNKKTFTRALRRRVTQAQNNSLPPRKETAQFAAPYLLETGPANWRNRFERLLSLSL